MLMLVSNSISYTEYPDLLHAKFLALTIWLEHLGAAGVDREEYGREEKDMHSREVVDKEHTMYLERLVLAELAFTQFYIRPVS